MWGSPHIERFPTPEGRPAAELSADTVCLGALRPRRASPPPPLQRPVASRSPGHPQRASDRLQIRGPHDALLGSPCQSLSQNLRRTPSPDQFIEGCATGCRCTARRRHTGEVPSPGPSVPVELGCITVPDVGVFTARKLPEPPRTPYSWGLTETPSRRHGQSPTPLPAPLPSLGRRKWGAADPMRPPADASRGVARSLCDSHRGGPSCGRGLPRGGGAGAPLLLLCFALWLSKAVL